MNRLFGRSRVSVLASLALGLGLLVGCSGDDPEAAGAAREEPEVLVKEPVQGVPNAPPFGAPREKLSPGEHVPEDTD